jgi:hypothetical protein
MCFLFRERLQRANIGFRPRAALQFLSHSITFHFEERNVCSWKLEQMNARAFVRYKRELLVSLIYIKATVEGADISGCPLHPHNAQSGVEVYVDV